MEKIALASDHAGFLLKKLVEKQLKGKGYEVLDLGTNSEDPVDYPDYANLMAETLKEGEVKVGVLICGSGLGMSMVANRHKGIRAALCHSSKSAELARLHNDANILVLGGRLIKQKDAMSCLDKFLSTRFEGGRHSKRVSKIDF
jgi:ribose 5-phosphate isomerase B